MKDKLSRLNRPSAWDLGNEMLYSLCSEYSDHAEPDVVIAKLWLVGRAYDAPLERGRPQAAKTTAEAFYTGRAVPIMLSQPVDTWLRELDGASLSWDDLPLILRTHKRFTDLFKSISGRAHRSLASKYLHFHRPSLFFLLDARSEERARAEVPTARKVDVPRKEIDPQYGIFARRCLELLERLAPHAPIELDPRAIDRYLLEY